VPACRVLCISSQARHRNQPHWTSRQRISGCIFFQFIVSSYDGKRATDAADKCEVTRRGKELVPYHLPCMTESFVKHLENPENSIFPIYFSKMWHDQKFLLTELGCFLPTIPSKNFKIFSQLVCAIVSNASSVKNA
jgi:hypothetical protein